MTIQTPYKTIPGPRGLPILGVMPEMVSDMLGLFTKTAREFGGIAQFKLLNSTYFLITNPDYIKYILQDNYKNYVRGRSVEPGRILLGNGLPLIDGEFWLRERRLLQPAFHRERLAALTSTAANVIDSSIQNWEQNAKNGQHLDVDG